MDEPLSNLDAKLRVSMRAEIAVHRRIRATGIYVTHDQTEAMTLADRIVIMSATKNPRNWNDWTSGADWYAAGSL